MGLSEYGRLIHLIPTYHTGNEYDKTRIMDMDTRNYSLKWPYISNLVPIPSHKKSIWCILFTNILEDKWLATLSNYYFDVDYNIYSFKMFIVLKS